MHFKTRWQKGLRVRDQVEKEERDKEEEEDGGSVKPTRSMMGNKKNTYMREHTLAFLCMFKLFACRPVLKQCYT